MEVVWTPPGFLIHDMAHYMKTREKRADFSTQLRLCCIEGTPCCAKILPEQAPSFRGWIVICKAICCWIWGVRSAGIKRSIYHRPLLSLYKIYIHWILLVTSWNHAVTWQSGNCQQNTKSSKKWKTRVQKTWYNGVYPYDVFPDLPVTARSGTPFDATLVNHRSLSFE